MAERQTAATPSREERSLTRGTPSGLGSSSWNAMQRFADEMDRMFDDFGLGRWLSMPRGRSGRMGIWAPDVDVYQQDDKLTIKADLPGLKREDVSVEVTDDAVTIQGERRHEREEEHQGVYR